MKHPIRITYIAVKELALITHAPPDLQMKIVLSGNMEPKILLTHGDYDEKTNKIFAFPRCEIGDPNPEKGTPLYIKVILGVEFTVDKPEEFPLKDVIHFTENYSRFLTHPFLREQVYSLSIRSGFSPIILPSIQVPVFKRADMVE